MVYIEISIYTMDIHGIYREISIYIPWISMVYIEISIYESVRFRTPDHRTFAYKIACWSYVGLVFFSDFWEKNCFKKHLRVFSDQIIFITFFCTEKENARSVATFTEISVKNDIKHLWLTMLNHGRMVAWLDRRSDGRKVGKMH